MTIACFTTNICPYLAYNHLKHHIKVNTIPNAKNYMRQGSHQRVLWSPIITTGNDDKHACMIDWKTKLYPPFSSDRNLSWLLFLSQDHRKTLDSMFSMFMKHAGLMMMFTSMGSGYLHQKYMILLLLIKSTTMQW